MHKKPAVLTAGRMRASYLEHPAVLIGLLNQEGGVFVCPPRDDDNAHTAYVVSRDKDQLPKDIPSSYMQETSVELRDAPPKL